jgi:hypothetical protein
MKAPANYWLWWQSFLLSMEIVRGCPKQLLTLKSQIQVQPGDNILPEVGRA